MNDYESERENAFSYQEPDPREVSGLGRDSLSGVSKRRDGFFQHFGSADKGTLWRILGGIFIVLALLILGLSIWRFAASSKKGLIPVIAPPSAPLRERPADPGGLQIMGDDLGNISAEKSGAVKLAPSPEAPDPNLLKEQHEAAERHRLEEEKRAALLEQQRREQEEAKRRAEQEKIEQAKAQKEHAAVKQQQSKSKAAQRSAAAVKAEDKKISSDLDLDSRIATLESHHPNGQAAVGKASVQGSQWQVQLGAYPNAASAQKDWQRFLSREGGLFAGHRPVLSHNGKGMIRLRTDGFDSASAAKRFCGEVASAGISCFPIRG